MTMGLNTYETDHTENKQSIVTRTDCYLC